MKESIIKMSDFGKILTDREDGKKALGAISSSSSQPYILDFSGVISLGSSFGGEVVGNLAAAQGNVIKVKNVINPIKNCLRRIEEDFKIKIIFLD